MRILAYSPGYAYIACGMEIRVLPFTPSAFTFVSASTDSAIILHAHAKVAAQSVCIALTVSICNTLLIAAYSDKSLCTWSIPTASPAGWRTAIATNLVAQNHCMMKKKTQCIRTAQYSSSSSSSSSASSMIDAGVRRRVILVGDKFGEVHALPFDMSNSLMITGHSTSVLTDMLVLCTTTPPNAKKETATTEEVKNYFLVTADRDEKIRVSCFPNVHTIQTYCLKHTHVISSIETGELVMPIATITVTEWEKGNVKAKSNVNVVMAEKGKEKDIDMWQHRQQVIISAGWDRLICVWDANSGALLGHCDVGEDSGASIDENDEKREKEEEEEMDEKKLELKLHGSKRMKSLTTTTTTEIDTETDTLKLVENENQDQDIDQDQDQDGDEDGDSGKTYNEENAGNFPTYISFMLHGPEPTEPTDPLPSYIAVAYKNSARLNIYQLNIIMKTVALSASESASASATTDGPEFSVELKLFCGYELPCEPCDIMAIHTPSTSSTSTSSSSSSSSSSLIILLPVPYCLIELSFDPTRKVPLTLMSPTPPTVSSSSSCCSSLQGLQAFRQHCIDTNIEYYPTYAGAEASQETHIHGKGTAFAKHILATPYTKMGQQGNNQLKKSDKNSSIRKNKAENKRINRENFARGQAKRLKTAEAAGAETDTKTVDNLR